MCKKMCKNISIYKHLFIYIYTPIHEGIYKYLYADTRKGMYMYEYVYIHNQ
jgi:hypothetical protein